MQPQEHTRRSAAQLCCASLRETATSMVSVAQGRRERKGFAEWWSYSSTEAILTHFMRKVGPHGGTGGRASMVAKNLWIFRNVSIQHQSSRSEAVNPSIRQSVNPINPRHPAQGVPGEYTCRTRRFCTTRSHLARATLTAARPSCWVIVAR